MIAQIALYVGLFLGGALAALKVIAPRTKNTKDDAALHYGEEAAKVLKSLGIEVPDGVEVRAIAAQPKA